jgi:hypothetical protein
MSFACSSRPRFLAFTLVCLLLAASSLPCVAQSVDTREDTSSLAQGAAMPAWVVPVLRLVSSTHVEPTTGVVISDSGLVLVPAGFASESDEIIVLDGGTDIVRHGRTARIEKDFLTQGFQLLRVSGLRRSGARLAGQSLEDGATVHLAAFPPAEQIAEGAEPLHIPATVVVFGENGIPAISGEIQLPNVTGALLDDCGNLVGMSIAHDVQSMESTPGTRYKWLPSLLAVLESMRITPLPGTCTTESETVTEESQPEDPLPEETQASEDQPAPEEDAATAAEDDEAAEPEPEIQEETPPEELELEILPPIESDTADETSGTDTVDEPESRAWPWLLLAALLFAGGVYLHRRRTRMREPDPEGGDDAPDASASPEAQETAVRTPALDRRLVLQGERADGSNFEVSCLVSRDAINVIIGRGQVDLRVKSLAVSRQHVRLNGTEDELTLTDLGSNNGTSINGIPCLEGEIMYVGSGDTILLGDMRFRFDFQPSGGDAEG